MPTNNEPAMSLTGGGIGNAQEEPLDPVDILKQMVKMHELTLSPAQKGTKKALEEHFYDSTKDALASGQQGIGQHIESQMGLDALKQLVGKDSFRTGMGEALKQSAGIGTLDQLLKASEVQKNMNKSQMTNPAGALDKIAGLNEQAKTKLPGYEFEQSADGNIYLRSKPTSEDPMMIGLKEDQRQDRLEQNYRTLWTKGISRYSGGLGLQDSKVNQAIDLRTLLNTYYDKKTGNYSIPPSQHTELVIGLARLLSPTGQIAQELVHDLRQGTAKEQFAKLQIYFGLDPVVAGGPTQSVIKMFANSIDRLGLKSEEIRNKYYDDIRKLAPAELTQERKDAVSKEYLGSSFKEFLAKSPDQQGNQGQQPSPAQKGFRVIGVH